MKKLLVLVVIATMVLTSMATSFAAYTDVPTTYPYYEAINKGTAVGLWKGTADGTVFDPYTFYSKEMVATTAVRLAGLEAYTAYNNTKPAFGDADKIPTWAWAYVNVAAAFGLVNGTPNGKGGFNFYNGVNKLISNAEVIAILDRAVGYEVGISTVGKWYGLYLGKAAEVGILNTIGTINPEANAVRGQVAQMAWNAANTKLVTKDSNGVFKPVDPATTLLASKLKATEATVVPTEATSTGFKARPVNVQVQNIAETEYVGTFNKADLGKTINVISVLTAEGKNNVVYYKDATPADKIVTPTLAAPSIAKDANNVYSVDVKDTTSDYVLSAGTVVYLNGTKVTDFATLLQVAPKSITVILDKNGNTQAVIASNYDFENFELTAAVDKTAPTLDTVSFNGATKNIAANAVITNNGAAAAIADLKAVVNKAVVYGRYGVNGDIVEIAAYSQTVQGVVSKTKVVGGSSVKTYAVLSDGTEVEIDSALVWTPVTNNKVVIVLNKDAKARLVTYDAKVQSFGKVTASLAANATEITVDIAGVATTYPLATNPTINKIATANDPKDANNAIVASISKKDYVYLTLNSEGKVSVIDEFELKGNLAYGFADTINKKVIAGGTPYSYDDSVVVEKYDGTYGTVADIPKDQKINVYPDVTANADAKILYVKVSSTATPDDVYKYGKYVGWSMDGAEITMSIDVNGTVENYVVDQAASGIEYNANKQTVPTTYNKVALVKVSGTNNKLLDFDDLDAVFDGIAAGTVINVVSGSTVYYDNYSKTITLDANVVVYKYKGADDTYTLATKADLVSGKTIETYDRNNDSKIDVVIFY